MVLLGEPFHGLEIKSVDGYQRERSHCFLYGTVMILEKWDSLAIEDVKCRTNQAKRGLIIIGNPNTLRHDGTWNSWLDWVGERNLFAWHLSQD